MNMSKYLSPYDRILYHALTGESENARKELRQFCRDYGYRFFRPALTYEKIYERKKEPTAELAEAAFQNLVGIYKGMLKDMIKEGGQVRECAKAILELFEEIDEEERAQLWRENLPMMSAFFKEHKAGVRSFLSEKTVKPMLATDEYWWHNPTRTALTYGAAPLEVFYVCMGYYAFKEGFYLLSLFIMFACVIATVHLVHGERVTMCEEYLKDLYE